MNDRLIVIAIFRGGPWLKSCYEVRLMADGEILNPDEIERSPVTHPVVAMTKQEVSAAITEWFAQDKEDLSQSYDREKQLQPPIYDPFGLMTGLLFERREALKEGYPISSADRLLELAQALEQLSKEMTQTSPKRKHKIKRLEKMISAGKTKFAATLEDSYGFGSIDEFIARCCDSCKVSSCVAKSNLYAARAIMRKIPP